MHNMIVPFHKILLYKILQIKNSWKISWYAKVKKNTSAEGNGIPCRCLGTTFISSVPSQAVHLLTTPLTIRTPDFLGFWLEKSWFSSRGPRQIMYPALQKAELHARACNSDWLLPLEQQGWQGRAAALGGSGAAQHTPGHACDQCSCCQRYRVLPSSFRYVKALASK